MSAYELVNLLEDLIECGELDLDAKILFFDNAIPEEPFEIDKYSVDDSKHLMLYSSEDY